jgi:hypothetical protein
VGFFASAAASCFPFGWSRSFSAVSIATNVSVRASNDVGAAVRASHQAATDADPVSDGFI